jgi:hypothetical protein
LELDGEQNNRNSTNSGKPHTAGVAVETPLRDLAPYEEESCAVASSTIGCLPTYISRYCDTQGIHRVCTPSERNTPCAAFKRKTRGIIPDCSGRNALSKGTPHAR